jgi:hypothetical protein
MSVETEIIGENPDGRAYKANVVKRNGDNGLVVFTENLKNQSNLFRPALNPVFGNEMAINATFSGTPDGIHNGEDNTYWTASTVTGTWDFASTTDPDAPSPTLNPGTPSLLCIEQVSNGASDEALFTRGSVLDSDVYAGMSGRLRLEQWGGSEGDKHIALQFRLAGVNVGGPINVDGFVDTSTLNIYQTFTFLFADIGVTGDIDELVITKVKTQAPHLSLDLIIYRLKKRAVMCPSLFRLPKALSF